MIDIDQLYAKTNQGKDIILKYYPNAEASFDNMRKSFKIRDESDASAYIFLGKNENCYRVKDFGASGKAQSPIDICMEMEGLNFYDALVFLAEDFGLVDSNFVKPKNEPTKEWRSPNPEERVGDIIIEEDSTPFNEFDFKIFGHIPAPGTKKNYLEDLNWIKVKSYTNVFIKKSTKMPIALVLKPTPTYPIYARRCYYYEKDEHKSYYKKGSDWTLKHFYKVYQPFSENKNDRFRHAPLNGKIPGYIHGLFELYQSYQKENDIKRQDRENPDAPYDMEKHEAIFLCSGERDAACIRAIDSHPIWANSETEDIQIADMNILKKYANKIYNIPDIDETGIKQGILRAKKFWDMYTIWLPKELRYNKDHRGFPKKDFRDWYELNPGKYAFSRLLNIADRAQFYDYVEDKKDYIINANNSLFLLNLYGFYKYRDELSKTDKLIHIDKYIIKEVTPSDIYSFLDKIALKRFLPGALRNKLVTNKTLTASTLDRLKFITLDLSNYTEESQFYFFKNKKIEITADSITECKQDKYVWEQNVIDKDINIIDDIFAATFEKKGGEYNWNIEVKNTNCNFFNYLINTSRMYWREELEDRLSQLSEDEQIAYRKKYKFSIDGSLLHPYEIQEHHNNLASKIFTIGYMLHRYKSDSKAWAPFAMDGAIGKDGGCNGRSGKSFFMKALTYMLKNTKRINGKANVSEDAHMYEGVDQTTDLVYFDDADENFPIKKFYSLITSDFFVNPKGKAVYNIPYEVAPKLAFTTNYIPYDFDSSTVARLLFIVFSDYYHKKTETNGYNEDWGIDNDFGKDLMRGKKYTEEEWNADLNFLLQCLKFYLRVQTKLGLKIQPPMDAIMNRKYERDMGGEAFKDWAYNYFTEERRTLNNRIPVKEAMRDFKESVDNSIDWKPNRFDKALVAFVKTSDYIAELNPVDVQQSDGRVQAKHNGRTVAGIYLRSVDEYNRINAIADKDENNNYEF